MFETDTKKLEIKSQTSKDIFTISYILTPKKFIEKRGSSYLVMQLDLNEETAIKISEIIKDIFDAEYYKDPYKNPSYGPKSISTLFEQAISKVNKSLGTLETEGYVKWNKNIHVTICTIKNTEIHLAYTGTSKALLLRDGTFIEFSQTDTRNETRIFAQTVSGIVKGDDIILISTPELLSYISKEKIKRSLKNKGVTETKKEIESILNDIDSVEAISSLFIHIKPKAHLLSNVSEKTLSSVKKDPILDTPPISIPLPNKPTTEKKSTGKKKPFLIGKKVKETFEISKRNQALSTAGYTDPAPQQKSTFLQKVKKMLESFFDSYLNTKAKGKIIGITSGIVAIILIIVIGGTYRSNKNNKAQAENEIILQEITKKENEAAQAIIYRDYNSAEILLNDAKQKIENNLDEKIQRDQHVKDLQLKIAADFDKINKVNRVDATLIAQTPSSENITSLIRSGSSIFISSGANAKIFELNASEQKFETYSKEADSIGTIRFAVFNEDKNTIAMLTENAIAEMPLFSQKISNQGNEFARKDHSFAAMTLYEDKIYLLDTANNQIYRHIRTVDGYGLGKEWIDDENIDVRDATSFSIDSNVYVMKKDGTVLKMVLGEKKSFSLSGFTDSFSSNTQIFTSQNTTFLYILDKENKALLVFTKKGELVNQYAFNITEDLLDFSVDEENQTTYILSENGVYSVTTRE